MKKLLLLGINRGTYDMINYAKSTGVFVILVDKFFPNTAPEKLVADEIWDIDTSDLDELEKRAREERIEAITAGTSEFNLDIAKKLCDRLYLPCHISDIGWEYARNKAKFKEICTGYELDTPRRYHLSHPPLAAELYGIKYPVIVKPVDSAGSIGLSFCRNEAELMAGCKKALSFSQSKQYLVEEYIEGHELVASYLMSDGESRLISVGECLNEKVNGMSKPSVIRFPAYFAKDYIMSHDEKVKKLINGLNCFNGTLFIQMIERDGKYYFLEYGITSALFHHLHESLTGLNEMRAIVNFALTGNIREHIEMANPLFSGIGIQYNLWSKGGTIAWSEGIDLVINMRGVKNISVFYQEGDRIHPDNSVKQMYTIVDYVAANYKEAVKTLRDINDTLKVYDTEGNDMLIRFENYVLLKADKPDKAR